MRLTEVAEVFTGYLFRSRLERDHAGKYGVIQMKDISEDRQIDWGGLSRVRLDLSNDVFLVSQGDILFKAKGSSYAAVVVDRDVPGVIASSHFFILRVRREVMLPAFLAWYLNQTPAKRYFGRESVGTGVQHISKESLSGLPVPVPDLATQQKIVYVNDLARRQRQLVDAIQERREALMSAVLLSAIKDRDKGE